MACNCPAPCSYEAGIPVLWVPCTGIQEVDVCWELNHDAGEVATLSSEWIVEHYLETLEFALSQIDSVAVGVTKQFYRSNAIMGVPGWPDSGWVDMAGPNVPSFYFSPGWNGPFGAMIAGGQMSGLFLMVSVARINPASAETYYVVDCLTDDVLRSVDLCPGEATFLQPETDALDGVEMYQFAYGWYANVGYTESAAGNYTTLSAP